MPHTEQAPFVAPIAELCIELGLSPDQVLVRDALELRGTPTTRGKVPAGAEGKTIFAVTPEDDPFLRGKFINAGWRHRTASAGEIFWRAFP